MKHITLLASLLLATAAFADEQDERTEKKKPAPVWHAEIGKPAPLFELATLGGKRWSLEAHRGKAVVLEWFHPGCPVVKKAHAEGGPLQTLGNRVARSEDAVWVAINSGAPGKPGAAPEQNVAGRREMAMEYPILLDPSGWVGRAFDATTTPQMYVIGPRGRLLYMGGHDGVAQALGEVRAGKKVSAPKTRNFGCGVKYASEAALGLAAPDFSLRNLDGQEVTLGALRGNIVVLEWFNPDCPVVKGAHEPGGTLADCADRAAEQGVVWLAINSGAPGKSGHGLEKNQAAKRRWGLSHAILLDPKGKVGRAFGATTTPEVFILDRRGVLAYHGAHDDRKGTSYVDQTLAELMAGRKVSEPKTRNYGCGVKYGD